VSPQDRFKAGALERIMRRHEGWQQRTISDLRNAGYHIDTIAEAHERLDAQRAFAGFTQAQLDIAMYAVQKQNDRKAS
jgi:hypothetical protein